MDTNIGREGWELVWSDEFDGSGLPDATEWRSEEGYVRNNEEQFYTGRLDNCFVKDGVLHIVCRKDECRAIQKARGKSPAKEVDVKYTSASLIGQRSFLYGRIEARAKIPTGNGSWPAVWMLGSNIRDEGIGWPKCGEIDIMENVGKEPENIHASLHWQGMDSRKHEMDTLHYNAGKPWEDFHVYAVEWYEDRIDFYYDDHKYHSVNLDTIQKGPDNPFRKPHYLIVNLALGGSWGGEVDESIVPLDYQIEYIRFYSKN